MSKEKNYNENSNWEEIGRIVTENKREIDRLSINLDRLQQSMNLFDHSNIPKYYNKKEYAKLVGLSRYMLEKAIKNGEVAIVELNGSQLIKV